MLGEQIANVVSYSLLGSSVVVGTCWFFDKCRAVNFLMMDAIEMSFRALADEIAYVRKFESVESENKDLKPDQRR